MGWDEGQRLATRPGLSQTSHLGHKTTQVASGFYPVYQETWSSQS